MAEEIEKAATEAAYAKDAKADASKESKLQLYLQSKIKNEVKLKKALETLAQIKKRFGR